MIVEITIRQRQILVDHEHPVRHSSAPYELEDIDFLLQTRLLEHNGITRSYYSASDWRDRAYCEAHDWGQFALICLTILVGAGFIAGMIYISNLTN